jgi:hypothetical protein
MEYLGAEHDGKPDKDVEVLDFEMIETTSVMVVLYRVGKKYCVDTYRFDQDTRDIESVPRVYQKFGKKQYKVAKWYYKLLVTEYRRGVSVVGTTRTMHHSSGL